MISYLKRRWFLLLLPLMLAGCKPGGLYLNIRYDQVNGLVEGDRLIFEQNHIGKVAGVTYTDKGDYTVAVVMHKGFAGSATEYSRFYITDDPQRKGHKAVEMVRVREGGTPLKDHATLDGSTRTSAVFEQMMGGFGTTFEELTKGFRRFMEELSQIPESEAFRDLEEKLKALSEEMKRSGQEARKKIQNEWLPQIEKQLEDLRERLREMGREDELKQLEVEFEKIKTSFQIP